MFHPGIWEVILRGFKNVMLGAFKTSTPPAPVLVLLPFLFCFLVFWIFCLLRFVFVFHLFIAVLGVEPRALHMLGGYLTTDLQPATTHSLFQFRILDGN